MSLLTILDTCLIGPLRLMLEVVFSVANRFIENPGITIVALNILVNILLIPLYRWIDTTGEDADAAVSGNSDDQRPRLNSSGRKQDFFAAWKPFLLELPLFLAAHQFLTHLQIINGVSLGPISDLSVPDGMLTIMGCTVHFLPVLMLALYLIYGWVSLRSRPMKQAVPYYARVLIYTAHLYYAPAGLVVYWMLNPLCSIVKAGFERLRNPARVLCVLVSVLGLAVVYIALFLFETTSVKRQIFLVGAGVAMQLPTILYAFRRRLVFKGIPADPDKKLFLAGSVFLILLTGIWIPSALISDSLREYTNGTYHPVWYLVSAASFAAGTFLAVLGAVYWLAPPKVKTAMDRLAWLACGMMLLNYCFFGTELGPITPSLQYVNGLDFSLMDQLKNLLLLGIALSVLYYLVSKWRRACIAALLAGCIVLGYLSIGNMNLIFRSMDSVSLVQKETQPQGVEEAQREIPKFQLSKKGKNVVVMMLDRGMGEYIPYIFGEKPELEAQFDGFTYYANTMSFASTTNFASPAVFGGYEYTPVEMNRRDQELLVDKHNEALKVMPVVFLENGYEVTVCDPPYANYQWIPDLSIYEAYPEINKYITKGAFGGGENMTASIENNNRNFFCFSIMKCMPLCTQVTFYNDARYNQIVSYSGLPIFSSQVAISTEVSYGMNATFMEPYNVLANMASMVDITEEEKNTCLVFFNDLTHEPMLLQMPDYVPAEAVNNTAFSDQNLGQTLGNGQALQRNNIQQMIHYQTNVAALLQLGKWFEYLKENDLYDNTRIILVADHGRKLNHMPEWTVNGTDLEGFYPLLMVKDFNSRGFETSAEFMTNADVPTLAFSGLIENPTNPFTGKPISSAEKTAHPQFIILSEAWEISTEDSKTFPASQWCSLTKNIWDKENWKFYSVNTVLKEHGIG